jgi:hypothetical protein
VGPAKAVDQRVLQRLFNGFGPSGAIQAPPQDFTGAAIEHWNKGTPTIGSALHQRDVR